MHLLLIFHMPKIKRDANSVDHEIENFCLKDENDGLFVVAVLTYMTDCVNDDHMHTAFLGIA